MKTERASCGFEEVAHTADWALRVWASDFPQLASTAVEGMLALMKPQYSSKTEHVHIIQVDGADEAELLVGLLSDVLFLLENQSQAPNRCGVVIKRQQLMAMISSVKVKSIAKMIKAVTYHNLEIIRTPTGLECTLVFDV